MATDPLRRADVDGYSIAYRCAGHGPALVLLHGFTLDSRIWQRQLEELSDRFMVVAWDAPGAGASSDPREPFTMSDWAQVLARFLVFMAIERAHILGMSWGGVLAQEFYRLYPARTRSLILAGTYAGWKGSLPPDVCSQRLAASTRGAELPIEEFVPQWIPGLIGAAASQDVRDELSHVVADLHPLGFRMMARTLADTDTRDLLPHIDVPTLLLWGDDDRRSPLSIAEQLRDWIPAAELVVMPKAGHVANMEQPDAFNAHVRRFLNGLRDDGRDTLV
jgi:pimeloyl-ACP methyl ester carboxylesterase